MPNLHNDKTDLKPQFLKALEQSLGVVKGALQAVGITRPTYRNWYNSDPEFARACDEMTEDCVDFAELSLYEQVKQGSYNATNKVLTCKGTNRGWNEKYNLIKRMKEESKRAEATGNHKEGEIKRELTVMKKKLIKALKEAKIYTEDLTFQIETTAQLLVTKNLLWRDLQREGFSFTTLEITREGGTREYTSNKMQLYLNTNTLAQAALKRLGLNFGTDGKKAGGDKFQNFMEEMEE